jgi:hypothetical protein
MSDQITVEGKEYISSKRASQLSDYTQDYIGQLARGAQIDAQRVGGLWFVLMSSLEAYKEKAEAYKPEPPVRTSNTDPESLLSFDGKDYVSAARAAKVTGYHQDYVGQLARSGTILSRQVGNRWYVEREGITKHKKEKDALLAAVQSESVGLIRHETPKIDLSATQLPEASLEQLFTYTSDAGDLLPFSKRDANAEIVAEATPARAIPIRVLPREKRYDFIEQREPVMNKNSSIRIHGKTMFYGPIAAAVFTIVIVIAVGFSNLGGKGMYAAAGSMFTGKATGPVAAIESVAGRIGDVLEALIVPDIVYKRSQ